MSDEQKINREIPIPLYYQISQLIRQQIESGELRPGDMIPTESELQQQFHVSRATVRQAISSLVYEGLLERRRSKGTIVSKQKLEETMYGVHSFTAEVLKRGMTPGVKVLKFEIVLCWNSLGEKLGLDSSEQVVWLERLRLVNGEPVALETSYIPLKFVPGVTQEMFEGDGPEQSSYYLLQQKFGVHLCKAVDTITAVAIEKREANQLGMEEGAPILLRDRITYAQGDIPVIYSRALYKTRYVVVLR